MSHNCHLVVVVIQYATLLVVGAMRQELPLGLSMQIGCRNMNFMNILLQAILSNSPQAIWKTRFLAKIWRRYFSKLQHAPSVAFHVRPPDTKFSEVFFLHVITCLRLS